MALTIAKVVGRFKKDVGDALSPSVIQAVCDDLEYVHRKRILDPVNTVHAFLTQVLHGNAACANVPHLTGQTFTASAYCKARGRLPLAVVENLFDCVSQGLYAERQATGLWFGHRVWIIDGSTFSMADEPELQKHFGQPGNQKPGCGFPVAHILALFHAGAGFLQRVIVSPMRTHDMAHAACLHREIEEGDIAMGDCAFASFAHLALISKGKRHAVFPCHQQQIVNFRPHRKHKKSPKDPAGLPTSRWLKRLGKRDQLVEYVKPKRKPVWMSDDEYAALPTTVVVRELRIAVKLPSGRSQTMTFVTTLLDPVRYPAAAIAALYGQRWDVETNLRHLKTTMKMEVLHCLTVEGVKKEVAMFALVYNLVRLVMLEASKRQQAPLSRISFIDALRWLRSATPTTPLRNLIVNPHRPNRAEPRVVKRRPKQYKRMTKPRAQLRKALRGKKLRA
jgi:hypothetical protein